MLKAKRIFFVADTKGFTNDLLLEVLRKYIKGFVRLGHDIQVFSYNNALGLISPIKSRSWAGWLYKSRVDKLLAKQIKNYSPDIVHVGFAKFLDAKTITLMRQAAPNAFFMGIDVDLWPELHKNRLEAAAKLDVVLTTFAGTGQQIYKDAGVRCVFVPNMCDPDIEHRYQVSAEWKSDILFTGKIKHKNYPTEDIRPQLIAKLLAMKNCAVYGCCGRPDIGGIDYFYAISGARMGLSINAANDIRLYHSDRFTQYLACGTFVLAKRVPDSDLLFKDGVHLRYFDTAEEFFDLANWYLNHENERIKIADVGMQRAQTEFKCEKMAKYVLDVVETGTYIAPWTD